MKTYKMHDDGKEYVTTLYKEGDFFGYIPLLKESPYSDSAVALEDCEVCKIPKNDFLALLHKNRDIAGISVYRRGALSTGNVNIPTGVVIQNNTVSGYSQPSASDGFGIVVEGTNHTVQNNTVSNNNIGIQQQAGHTPYVENVGGGANDGDQNNLSDQYFGRGNAPFTCGNVITGNTFSGNGTNTRNVGAGVNTLAGVIVNTNNGETFCSIQTAIDDSNTASGNTITANPGTFVENVSLNKTLTLKGAKQGVDARGRVSGSPNPAVESVIAPASGKALDLLSGTGASTIDGFSMVSAPASGTAGVISSDVAATDGLQLKNNYIAVSSGSGAALWLNKNAIDANIENNEFTGATGSTQVVYFDGGDQFHGLYFRNNNVLRSGAVGNTGIFVDGNRNIGTSVSSRTPQIKGNLFQGHALGLNGGSRSFENAEISENTFNGNTGGMAAGPKTSSIVRNTFSNNTGYGLRLTSFGNTSDPTRGAQNSTVQNNFFSGNGTTVDMTNGYGDLRIDNQYTGVVATNTISDNSFGSTIALFNNETGGELVNAECNWFGSASAATVTGKIINQTGAFTDATPWLTNGTDNDVLTAGFQPVPLSCTGYPVHNLTQSTDYSTI
ncbi:MAG TPA: cyclic nucleotide-binding domain-containing protein, partial [Saprospiraceae bacterium]|nr:cyclic nucleotide-binding domain-containing protein [Saprospiraceae bacterium]